MRWRRLLAATVIVGFFLGPVAGVVLLLLSGEIVSTFMVFTDFSHDPRTWKGFLRIWLTAIYLASIWAFAWTVLFGLPVASYLEWTGRGRWWVYGLSGLVGGGLLWLLLGTAGELLFLFISYGATYAGLFWLSLGLWDRMFVARQDAYSTSAPIEN